MEPPQPYGDLVALDTERLILDAVGRENLEAIVADYLASLGTSAAVYEKKGDYAAGIFSSAWCRFLDARSREGCATSDNREALASGLWHCHESCWTEASKVSIERGEPVDVACRGGIRIYAVPVVARGEVVGSINFGYGTPPTDPDELAEVAERYDVPVKRLVQSAREYVPRPSEVVEVSKRHLRTTARLVAALVERRLAEQERDTSEQHAREKDVLIREVHHRVKNNLQVITSLLELQARHAADAASRELLRESQRRVRTIALVHEKIHQSGDLGSIDFGAYLEILVRTIVSMYDTSTRGIVMETESDDVRLGIDAAMHSGLIVNELVSNAVIHAFPAGRGGRIGVALRRDGDALTLVVADDGVGLPPGLDFRRSPSLGLQLVCSLTEQLGGTVDATRDAGTAFTVRFPVPATPPRG